MFLAGLLVLGLPGATWLVWFSRPGTRSFTALADAAGLSLALTALAALSTFLLNYRITAAVLIVLGVLMAGLLGFGIYRRRPGRPGIGGWIILVGLVGAIGWRLYQARDLALPAWVDPIHHALIIQAILQRGGLPADLSPYLPVPLYYHFGYHAIAALFTAVSRQPVQQAMLALGQVLSALVGLSVFRLGMTIWSDWRRAAAAGLLVTLAFHMPAYYLTWGRYPLLTGLVLLPLAMAAALEVSAQERWQWEPALRLAVLTGGIFLTHYLATLIFGLFIAVLGLLRLWRSIRTRQPEWPGWQGLVAGIGAGMLVAAPWIYRIWVYSSGSFRVDAALTTGEADKLYFSGYASYLWTLAGPLRNHILLGGGLLGGLIALRKPGDRALGLWGLLLGLLSLPYGIKLGPFRPDLMLIVLFLPCALLLPSMLISLADWSRAWVRVGICRAFWIGLVAGACCWGIIQTRSILNPSTVFSDKDDLSAVQWAGENTPAAARFFINTSAWQSSIYRGVDGGWWLLPLANRQTLLPPAAYGWGSKEYIKQIGDLAERASQVKGCTPEFWSLVKDAKLDYAFLHAGQGGLQPDQLKSCSGAKWVYHAGNAWIFELTPPTSSGG